MSDGVREVVAAVIASSLGVLAVRRADGLPPWAFPGGEIEPGEARCRPPSARCGRRLATRSGRTAFSEAVCILLPAATSSMWLPSWVVHTDAAVAAPGEVVEARWLTSAEAARLMPDMHEPVRTYLAARALR